MKLKLGRYKHYKGHIYQVVAIAKHSETLEDLVVYQGEYDDPEFGSNPVWVRPLAMFLEEVEIDGQKVPRFQFLDTAGKTVQPEL